MLLDSDVDLRRGSIEIRGESNSDSRRIPIGRDVRQLVRRYLGGEHRRKFGLGRPLFLTLTGGSIRYGVLELTKPPIFSAHYNLLLLRRTWLLDCITTN